MITVRELSEKYDKKTNIECCLKEIEDFIVDAAKRGEFKIKYQGFNFGGGHLYGGEPTKLQSIVISKLQEAGYKTEVRCEERSFVDIWLEISWGD